MSTIHLVYSILKRVLDSLTNVFNTRAKHTVVLIKRQISQQILNEYSLLPLVINDIIYGYLGEKIKINCDIDIIDLTTGDYDDKCIHYRILLTCNFNNDVITIDIDYVDNMIFYYVDLGFQNHIVHSFNNSYIDNPIPRLNVFMKKMYNRDNYINCPITVFDNSYIFFMKQNSIVSMSQKEQHIDAMRIKNYRKLTYLIVELKCIINGIQRYFRENDILEYCKKAFSIQKN